MKVLLPSGIEHELDEKLELSEKIAKVEELLFEHSESIINNWKSDNVKFFLDSLSNYLVWHKEDGESGHDKEVMSKNKTNRMIRGRKDTPFSSLGKQSKEMLFCENGGNE